VKVRKRYLRWKKQDEKKREERSLYCQIGASSVDGNEDKVKRKRTMEVDVEENIYLSEKCQGIDIAA